ncbi:MAG TPA: glycosyltransferase [Burkholderiales bacterium]
MAEATQRPPYEPTVHVVLPVHNRKVITLGFVRCLLAQTYAHHRLLLVDDGSTDGTAQAVRELLPTTAVLHGAGDWWWAGALQQAYLHLKTARLPPGDLVLICNDDTSFDPAFLGNAVAVMQGQRNCMLLAQLYDDSHNGFIESGVHVDWRHLTFTGVADPARINCFATRGLFQRVDDYLSLGGFHPRLLPHYASDYEYTIRAHRRGRRLLTDPAVRLAVNQSATGVRKLTEISLRRHLRTVFSKRYVANPWYQSMFILLACPPRWKLVNLYRTWKIFLSDLRQIGRPRAS